MRSSEEAEDGNPGICAETRVGVIYYKMLFVDLLVEILCEFRSIVLRNFVSLLLSFHESRFVALHSLDRVARGSIARQETNHPQESVLSLPSSTCFPLLSLLLLLLPIRCRRLVRFWEADRNFQRSFRGRLQHHRSHEPTGFDVGRSAFFPCAADRRDDLHIRDRLREALASSVPHHCTDEVFGRQQANLIFQRNALGDFGPHHHSI